MTMDVCDEEIALAGRLEEHLLQEVPINFDDVRGMRDAQHDLASRLIGNIDNAVMRMEAVAHRLRTKARVARADNYDDILRLLERVQAWEQRVTEAEELN